MQHNANAPQGEIDLDKTLAAPESDAANEPSAYACNSAAPVDAPPSKPHSSEPPPALANRAAAIVASMRERLASVGRHASPHAPRRLLATGKRTDRLIIIAASGMLAAAAAIIAIGAMDALPGQSSQTAPAQTGGGASNLGNINISGGGTLSEGGQPVGNPILGTPGPVTGPFISGDENAGVEFSTSHIHLIDPASSPNTPTPTPEPSETSAPDAQ